jgi:phosphatidylglycerol---prolipoprotein diacylglyceryl transferase
MLDWSGGAFLALLTAFIYGQRKKMPFWLTIDALTPGFAIFMIAYGFALLASGDAFGTAAQLPWSIYLWGEWRHPTQIYAILAAIAITTIVWPRSKVRNSKTWSAVFVVHHF